MLAALAGVLPELVGGAGDLTASTRARPPTASPFTRTHRSGSYIHWGVREHAMVAACVGMAAPGGGSLPYAATFLNFLAYGAGAVRLAALSGARVLLLGTHDSVGLGGDGPTHQPVEALAWLRAMPNM